MQYFLLLVILGLCGGGYYEYTNEQQQKADAAHQISDLTDQVNKLKADAKSAEDAQAAATKSLDEAKAQVATLTTQLAMAQKSLDDLKKQSSQVGEAGKSATAQTSSSMSSTNSLDTITTLDGKTYANCQLLKVDSDGVTVSYTLNGGPSITKIAFAIMRPELQKKFGYDPHQAAALTDAQIQYNEQQQKASQAATTTVGN